MFRLVLLYFILFLFHTNLFCPIFLSQSISFYQILFYSALLSPYLLFSIILYDTHAILLYSLLFLFQFNLSLSIPIEEGYVSKSGLPSFHLISASQHTLDYTLFYFSFLTLVCHFFTYPYHHSLFFIIKYFLL